MDFSKNAPRGEPLEVDVEQYTELLLPLWEGDEPRFGLF